MTRPSASFQAAVLHLRVSEHEMSVSMTQYLRLKGLLQGKSLSLICGSLTWLRDHKGKTFTEGLNWTQNGTL